MRKVNATLDTTTLSVAHLSQMGRIMWFECVIKQQRCTLSHAEISINRPTITIDICEFYFSSKCRESQTHIWCLDWLCLTSLPKINIRHQITFINRTSCEGNKNIPNSVATIVGYLHALNQKYTFWSVFFVVEIAFATITAGCSNMRAAIWRSTVCYVHDSIWFAVWYFFSRAITECRRVCKCEKKTAADEKSELNAQWVCFVPLMLLRELVLLHNWQIQKRRRRQQHAKNGSKKKEYAL